MPGGHCIARTRAEIPIDACIVKTQPFHGGLQLFLLIICQIGFRAAGLRQRFWGGWFGSRCFGNRFGQRRDLSLFDARRFRQRFVKPNRVLWGDTAGADRPELLAKGLVIGHKTVAGYLARAAQICQPAFGFHRFQRPDQNGVPARAKPEPCHIAELCGVIAGPLFCFSQVWLRLYL